MNPFLLEEPDALDAKLLQEEEVEAKAEAKKNRPGLTTMFTDGSRLEGGTTDSQLCGGRAYHGQGPKCTWATTKRPMMRSALHLLTPLNWQHKGTQPRNESPLLRHAGSYQADGIGRTWSRAAVRHPGKEAYRGTATG